MKSILLYLILLFFYLFIFLLIFFMDYCVLLCSYDKWYCQFTTSILHSLDLYIYICVCVCVLILFIFIFFRVIICSIEQTLLQILTLFERVLKRDFLSSNFATTEELLGSCTQSGSSLHDFSDPRSVPVLPWIPQTMTAVALRLFELDASVIYLKQEKPEPFEDKEVREYIVSIFFFFNEFLSLLSFFLVMSF